MQKVGIDLGVDWCHPPLERSTRDFAFVIRAPMFEQRRHLPHEVVPEPSGLPVRAFDQGLDGPFQVGTAPLQLLDPPVHLGSVAVHESAEGATEQLVDSRASTTQDDGVHRVDRRHRGPQPSVLAGLLRRRLVHGRPPFHQGGQRGERHQARARLAERHAYRQRTGGLPAARALQSVTLVYGDVRIDLGKLPDLVPQ